MMTINPEDLITSQIPKSGLHYLFITQKDLLSIESKVQKQLSDKFGLVFIKSGVMAVNCLEFFPSVVLFPNISEGNQMVDHIVDILKKIQDGKYSDITSGNTFEFHGTINPLIAQLQEKKSEKGTQNPKFQNQKNVGRVYSTQFHSESMNVEVKGDLIQGNKVVMANGSNYIQGDQTTIQADKNSQLHLNASAVNIDQRSEKGDQVNINKINGVEDVKIHQESGKDQVNINRTSGNHSSHTENLEKNTQNTYASSLEEVKCKVCGTINQTNVNFCKSCGNPLEKF